MLLFLDTVSQLSFTKYVAIYELLLRNTTDSQLIVFGNSLLMKNLLYKHIIHLVYNDLIIIGLFLITFTDTKFSWTNLNWLVYW